MSGFFTPTGNTGPLQSANEFTDINVLVLNILYVSVSQTYWQHWHLTKCQRIYWHQCVGFEYSFMSVFLKPTGNIDTLQSATEFTDINVLVLNILFVSVSQTYWQHWPLTKCQRIYWHQCVGFEYSVCQCFSCLPVTLTPYKVPPSLMTSMCWLWLFCKSVFLKPTDTADPLQSATFSDSHPQNRVQCQTPDTT